MSNVVSLKTLLAENTMDSAPELVVSGADGVVRCFACGHRCQILPDRSGVCRVRFNEGGILKAPAGYVAGVQIDPIEKKPFFHAYPGRQALSFGMLGCDLHCAYCQNWVTSQVLRDDQAVYQPNHCTPEQLVELAVERRIPVMVSTYNEPLITADWAVEIFKLAKSEGIVCGFVSNGNATPQVLKFIQPYVDLYKVDLKSFDDRNYRRLGGVLENVLDTIRRLVAMGFWVEIVTLVVPGFNDSDDELSRMVEFIASVSPSIPWHVTAFHPDYKMTGPTRTPIESLLQAYKIGKRAGLEFVYPGNLPGQVGDCEDTACPACGTWLIRRQGFHVMSNVMKGPCCPACNFAIPGRWESSPAPLSSAAPTPLCTAGTYC